jgi:hypothetical protein
VYDQRVLKDAKNKLNKNKQMQTLTLRELKNVIKKTHGLLIDKQRSLPMMVWGPMGLGKSSIFKQAASDLKIGIKDLRLSLLNAVDLRGLPTIDKKEMVAVWLSSGFLPRVERDGKEGILLLDEINLAPMTVMNAGYSLILDREVGEYKLPPGWIVVAAGNRAEDSNNLTKMPNPLLNRFVHYQVERPEIDEWRDWAIKNDISDKAIAFLSKFPQHLMRAPKAGDRAFATPRTWQYASDLISIGEPIDAAVGEGVASEFKAFTEVYARVPDIQKILKGEKERIPKNTELDVLWATSMALVIAAKPTQWENMFSYVSNFPTEFQVLVIKLCSEKSDEWFNAISHSPEFIEFRKKHPALVERDSDE